MSKRKTWGKIYMEINKITSSFEFILLWREKKEEKLNKIQKAYKLDFRCSLFAWRTIVVQSYVEIVWIYFSLIDFIKDDFCYEKIFSNI